jgi:hypothetical protein
MAKITPETRSKALNFVKESKEKYRSQRISLEDKWEEFEQAWRVLYEQNNHAYKGDSKYATPIIHDNIEAIVARGAEASIFNDKAVDIETAPDQRQKAEVYKVLATKQAELQDIDHKKEMLWRIMAKYGTAFVKETWIEDIESVKTRTIEQLPVLDEDGNPVFDEMGQPIIEQNVVEKETDQLQYIGPGYDVIKSINDIFIDRYVEDVQDQPIVIHRYFIDWQTIDQGVKDGVYEKDIAERIKEKPFVASIEDKSIAEQVSEGLNEYNTVEGMKRLWEVYEGWADFDLYDKGEEIPCLITVVNDQVLGIRENPYWHKQKPFLQCKYREKEGEAYGMGAVEPVLNLWYDYNDTMNQINDARAFVLNPVMIERAGIKDKVGDESIYPGKKLIVKQPGDIQPLPMDLNQITGGIQALLELEQRINRGMGVTNLLNGTGDDSDLDQTWRATKTVIAQADKKFKRIAIRFEQDMWRSWLRMGLKLNAQLLDTLEPYFNDLPIDMPVDPQQIIGSYRFSVKGVEHFFDMQDRLEKTMLFADRSVGKPWVNPMALDMQIAEMMGLKDIDQIIVQPPPQEPTPAKPASISISLNPKDGAAVATTAAQVLQQNGYNIDLNQALDDADILTERTAPTSLVNSGILPDDIEEDIIENADDESVDKKIQAATGIDPGTQAIEKAKSVNKKANSK